jgi:N4-gp56 family major capsid protein
LGVTKAKNDPPDPGHFFFLLAEKTAMAATNFAALTSEQLTVWSRDFWREARNRSFVMGFVGTGHGAMIQRIDELSTVNDGARAVITLVNDATGDGVVGDNQLKGNEEALRSTECVIQIDQWRAAHRNTGRMSDQKSVVKFRNEAKDKLSYTAARVMDELAFLTMSGISYAYHTNGALRTGSQLNQLEFAADVEAPSSRRHYRWDAGTTSLVAGNTADMVDADLPTWNMLVQMKAKAVNEYIRPIRTDGGIEMYHVFMSPDGMARLKQDENFLKAWREAGVRGDSNDLFKGTPHGGKKGIYIDGLNILEYRNVYTTLGASAADQWNAAGTDLTRGGQRIILAGAQALAYADIKGSLPTWVEDQDDYDNTYGIATGKMFGLLKPQLYSTHAASVQDFGLMVVDTAL